MYEYEVRMRFLNKGYSCTATLQLDISDEDFTGKLRVAHRVGGLFPDWYIDSIELTKVV